MRFSEVGGTAKSSDPRPAFLQVMWQTALLGLSSECHTTPSGNASWGAPVEVPTACAWEFAHAS